VSVSAARARAASVKNAVMVDARGPTTSSATDLHR
jgi:hypothetical protein